MAAVSWISLEMSPLVLFSYCDRSYRAYGNCRVPLSNRTDTITIPGNVPDLDRVGTRSRSGTNVPNQVTNLEFCSRVILFEVGGGDLFLLFS